MQKKSSLSLRGLTMPLLTAIIIICGCNSRREENKDLDLMTREHNLKEAGTTPSADIHSADADSSLAAQPGPFQSGARGHGLAQNIQEFLLVREASIDLSVADVSAAAQKIRHWIAQAGGYYSDWTREQQQDQLSLSVTARIPSGSYEGFIDSAEQLGVLRREHAGAVDQMDKLYADLEARALRHRISGEYNQLGQRLQKGADQLGAQDQSASNQEGESAAAIQIMQTRREAAITSIQLHLLQPHPIVVIEPGFFTQFVSNLADGLHILENLALFLAGSWPWILLLAGAALVIKSFAKDLSAKPRPAQSDLES